MLYKTEYDLNLETIKLHKELLALLKEDEIVNNADILQHEKVLYELEQRNIVLKDVPSNEQNKTILSCNTFRSDNDEIKQKSIEMEMNDKLENILKKRLRENEMMNKIKVKVSYDEPLYINENTVEIGFSVNGSKQKNSMILKYNGQVWQKVK